MRVNTTLSHFRGGCGLFGWGRLICMRCAMVICFIRALSFFSIFVQGLTFVPRLRLWYARLCAFLLLCPFSCTLLPPSPFFFFQAGFPSLPAVVSLSNSTASLNCLLEFAQRPSLFLVVFFVSLTTRSFNAC